MGSTHLWGAHQRAPCSISYGHLLGLCGGYGPTFPQLVQEPASAHRRCCALSACGVGCLAYLPRGSRGLPAESTSNVLPVGVVVDGVCEAAGRAAAPLPLPPLPVGGWDGVASLGGRAALAAAASPGKLRDSSCAACK